MTALIAYLDLLLSPGTHLGVLGLNGSGKTTLLRMIVGELPSDSGTIETMYHLRVVCFEQSRQSLDPNPTLAPEGDTIVYGDLAIRVVGWAKRFLFRNEQLDTAVSRLSGGEKARLVLARLMLQPADLLVLDEPTNDLDIPPRRPRRIPPRPPRRPRPRHPRPLSHRPRLDAHPRPRRPRRHGVLRRLHAVGEP